MRAMGTAFGHTVAFASVYDVPQMRPGQSADLCDVDILAYEA